MLVSRKWWFAFVLLSAVVAIGCGGSGGIGGGGAGGGAGTGGAGGDQGPGSLLSAEEIDPADINPLIANANAWKVVYASEAIDAQRVEVSGLVVAPDSPPEEGLRGVVAYAHGTTGLFDPCAPSRAPFDWAWDLAQIAPDLVDAGYVVAATDYEGLGMPPDTHRYHVGVSEGRGVLDIVRAARQIDEAHASNRAVVWGVSQGGHAALFAGEIAPEWAPEIEVLGVVPTAPSSELDIMQERAEVPDIRGYLWQIFVSYEEVYPGLSLGDILDAETITTIESLVGMRACSPSFVNLALDEENAGLTMDPADLPAWREALIDNSPGYVRSEMPVLLLQGSADVVVPKWITDLFFDRLCDTGTQTDYRVLEGLDHVEAFTSTLSTQLEWTNARFAGEAPDDTCPN